MEENFEADPWQRLREELRSRGVSVQQTLQDHENRDFLTRPGDPSYAAIMHPEHLTRLDEPALAALFTACGMSIIDLASPSGYLGHDFCVWFERREKVSSLRRPDVTARNIEHQMAHIAARFGTSATDLEVLDTGYGPHGRLMARLPRYDDRVFRPGLDQERQAVSRLGSGRPTPGDGIVIDFGPWGWTLWEFGQWEQSHPYAPEEEQSNLGLIVSGSLLAGPHLSAPSETKYRFIERETREFAFLPGGYDVVAAIAATYFFAPFINAFMSKVGEDCYQALRARLRPESQSNKCTSVIDRSADSELVFQAPLPDEAIRQLAKMDPKLLRRRTATWNQQTAKWEISHELRPKQPRKIFTRLPPS